MRNGNWKIVLVAVLFSAGTTAYLMRPADAGGGGGSKGGGGGSATAGSDEGEIEMGDDDAGSGSDDSGIEMEGEGSAEPSLEGDINAANQDNDAVVASQLKAATKPVSWSDIVT